MILVNAAPEDQSGRSFALANYFSKNTHLVLLLTYPGLRQPDTISKNIIKKYLWHINTDSQFIILTRIKQLLKFIYLNIVTTYYLLWYFITSSNTHPIPSPTILFVVPPLPTILLPFICAYLLGIQPTIDWHRVTPTTFNSFPGSFLTRYAANIAVTTDMAKLMKARHLRATTITDADLFSYVDTDSPLPQPSSDSAFFQYLAAKYPEYRSAFQNPSRPIAICSTSNSPEEDISSLLQTLSSIPVKGTLFFTTKSPISLTHLTLNVHSVFLDHADYLLLLTHANFGISTHACSYDYPLKIIDYLRARLPVIAHSSTPAIHSPSIEATITRYTTLAQLGTELQASFNRHQLSRHQFSRH
ncbi:beta-1,4-mannosyltransferase [Nematocida homosporus]|uniref:beta-1,4-mannosyltransferase n=1 Tax=Nematocida homosporus TaxID=1912981 RepID=UPI00221F9534|nr:beta-1,4-mannosyltransferase [Nematocida homosporus]KAI5184774.1 beta-1,4-mannosyltransferase [Nematocida homosporus]